MPRTSWIYRIDIDHDEDAFDEVEERLGDALEAAYDVAVSPFKVQKVKFTDVTDRVPEELMDTLTDEYEGEGA